MMHKRKWTQLKLKNNQDWQKTKPLGFKSSSIDSKSPGD